MFFLRTDLRIRRKAFEGGLRALPVFLALAAASALSARGEAAENPVFGYPHLLESPYTLPAGTFVYGSALAFGLTDFLQVGTNLYRDLYGYYNANAKLSLLDYPEFAASLTVGFTHYNLNDIDSLNPDVSVTAWQPGVVTAYGLVEDLALFVGGHLEIEESEVERQGVRSSGLVQGAVLEADLSLAYNRPTRGRGVGNVVSAGVSYDATYELIGLGVSHHWPGFQLGVHYYPGADQNRFLPIIAGGGSASF